MAMMYGPTKLSVAQVGTWSTCDQSKNVKAGEHHDKVSVVADQGASQAAHRSEA